MSSNLFDPSRVTLLVSSTLYPLLLHLSLPQKPSPTDLALRRESLSAVHSAAITLLSLKCLHDSNTLALLSPSSTNPTSKSSANNPAKLPIITTRSTFGNALTALETGYLLQDTVVLIYAAQLRRRYHHGVSDRAPTLNLTHLTTHHVPLLCAFAALQVSIARHHEKGILLIVLLLLMNASTPLGTLRWYLRRFRPGTGVWIAATTAAYLAVYGVSRVWLLWWMLKRWGMLTGKGSSALEGYQQLRWECRTGMAGMGAVNTLWFLGGVVRFVTKPVFTGKGSNRKE